ncbi:SPOR domain-containing protein [Microbacterium xanthum]|uniref:SPOR domain-containing protein n=1 Tax=Microbacterium xanthum TaxID=3079794 RepID=UPI002AD2363A|nr:MULTISPECIES: SPOR domain-containing protein [unclassified Microbacterium]MDZ8172809.1 SPOR domain-containing protein [Microbacterium sp. KSW-48]MDZ8202353.1 SPOR domain-containing protein [Microbacterium sp. SSW1-59]
MSASDEKFWYNLSTGQVEQGHVSPAVDRAGPFDTADEAARAPQLMKERSRAWAEDEARDDAWGASGPAPEDK